MDSFQMDSFQNNIVIKMKKKMSDRLCYIETIVRSEDC